jgi:hypothetical protein
VPLYKAESEIIYSDSQSDTPAFYHYWQVFWLAAILRSGVHIYYPLDDEDLAAELWRGDTLTRDSSGGRLWQSVNLEAYHELQELRSFQHHFDAVGYFKAYSHNAFQFPSLRVDQHGRLSNRQWRQFLSREREIGRNTLRISGLSEDDLIAFVGQQCEWWDNARRVGPPAVAEEYKRNITKPVSCKRNGTQRVLRLVGG